MLYLLIAIAVLFSTLFMILMMTRLIFQANHCKEETTFSIKVLGCGMIYDFRKQLPALTVRRWRYYLKMGNKKREKTAKGKFRKRDKTTKPKSVRKLNWSVRVRIGKALLLYSLRFLNGLKYEEALLVARPVLPDPALAGMAYGFGAALYGVFPGLRQTVDVWPDFAAGETRWMGQLEFSIKIRQVFYNSYRLLLDLPIKELIGHWMKRGK
jgi:hypothetical protein